jgi:hypothetical protein
MKHSFSMVSRSIFTLAFLGLGIVPAIAESATDLIKNPPDRWIPYEQDDLTALNGKLKAMSNPQQNYDPLMLTPQLFGQQGLWTKDPKDDLNEEPSLLIVASEKKTDPNGQPYLLVTYLVEGLPDDSVRGEWLQISYEMTCDRWKITAVNAAYRCWRGDDTDSYSGRLCP